MSVFDREIVWEIQKHHGLIELSYQPGYENEYLYLPFIRNYNSKIGHLNYHLTDSSIVWAEDLPYCQSRWYTSSFADYKLFSGLKTVGVGIYQTELSNSAYYGNDTKTWQIHYPFNGLDSKEFSLVFNEYP